MDIAPDHPKEEQWNRFAERIKAIQKKGKHGLRSLSETEIGRLIDEYHALTSDLARARSLGAPDSTINRLNRIAVTAHAVLYAYLPRRHRTRPSQWHREFARSVRDHKAVVLLAALFLFFPAVVTFLTLQWHPTFAYDIVPEGFLHFDPADEDKLHKIPDVAQPVFSSAIIANNIQVTLFAFGLGLTAGIGTAWILVSNGIHLGAIAGYLTSQGQARALWGWIMPHGATELLAICISGAAGFLLARAMLNPGLYRRTIALKQIGPEALKMELGCMGMLVIAGLIEGFVSPSPIGFAARIGVLTLSLTAWLLFFTRTRKSDHGTISLSGLS